MRKTMSMVGILGALFLVSSCVIGGTGDDATSLDSNGKNSAEALYVKGELCEVIFHGTESPDADMFAIWNMGSDAILDVPYPTDERPDLYGIFVAAGADIVHHVDGYTQFDHYHLTAVGQGDDAYDGTWDVYLVFPGPNYDAANYTAATTLAEMEAQQAAGILGPTVTTVQAGFAPLVWDAPIVCRG